MIQVAASNEFDWLFLELCCAVKGFATERTAGHRPSMQLANGRVVGLAASAIALEALAPTPSLFPNGNIGMPLALIEWSKTKSDLSGGATAHLTANVDLIDRQLADGRSFLQGEQPGLADVCSAAWVMPRRQTLQVPATTLSWLDRMLALCSHAENNTQSPRIDENTHAALAASALLRISEADGEPLVFSTLD